MATPIDLRAWAAAIRRWTATVSDQLTAAKMRRLVDDLDRLARRKDKDGALPPAA
jgi:hypothetical protein